MPFESHRGYSVTFVSSGDQGSTLPRNDHKGINDPSLRLANTPDLDPVCDGINPIDLELF